MAKIRYLIEVYYKNSQTGGYSSTPNVVIIDGITLDNDASIESTADSFSFRVANPKTTAGYAYTGKVRVDDRVIIYMTSVTDLVDVNKTPIADKGTYQRFDGIITEVKYTLTQDSREIIIKGLNRLEKLLNFTFPGIFEGKTGSEIIAELIGHCNDGQRQSLIPPYNRVNQITWASGNDATTTKLQYWRTYRPVFEMIEELSSQKINKEFNAYYYLNSSNEMVWMQKSNDLDSLQLQEGVDIMSVTMTEKVWDVVNAMIVDCGIDARGRGIHAIAYDEASAAEYGLRWAPTIEVETEIAEAVKENQQEQPGWVDANKDGFPDTYDFTMTFRERTDVGVVPQSGAYLVVSNDVEYNNALRKEIKWTGVEWIKSVLDITGSVRPKCDVTMQGSHWETGVLDSGNNPIQQGDMVEVESATFGWSGVKKMKLRVKSLNHELSWKGWIVTLRLEEDVEDFNPAYVPSGH